jgi:hypothetical protein
LFAAVCFTPSNRLKRFSIFAIFTQYNQNAVCNRSVKSLYLLGKLDFQCGLQKARPLRTARRLILKPIDVCVRFKP